LLQTGTFTHYVWNIAQMMLFNYTCPEEMTAPPNFVPLMHVTRVWKLNGIFYFWTTILH